MNGAKLLNAPSLIVRNPGDPSLDFWTIYDALEDHYKAGNQHRVDRDRIRRYVDEHERLHKYVTGRLEEEYEKRRLERPEGDIEIVGISGDIEDVEISEV